MKIYKATEIIRRSSKKSFDSISPMFLSIICIAGRINCFQARNLSGFLSYIFHTTFSISVEVCNSSFTTPCFFTQLHSLASLFELKAGFGSPPSIQICDLSLLQSERSAIPIHFFLFQNSLLFHFFLLVSDSSSLQASGVCFHTPR